MNLYRFWLLEIHIGFRILKTVFECSLTHKIVQKQSALIPFLEFLFVKSKSKYFFVAFFLIFVRSRSRPFFNVAPAPSKRAWRLLLAPALQPWQKEIGSTCTNNTSWKLRKKYNHLEKCLPKYLSQFWTFDKKYHIPPSSLPTPPLTNLSSLNWKLKVMLQYCFCHFVFCLVVPQLQVKLVLHCSHKALTHD